MKVVALELFFVLLITLITWNSMAAETAILTQHNDIRRSGSNLNESTLNTSNVNPSTFGLLFERDVEGQLFAQPLYVPHLQLSGRGIHNVILLATSENNIYAFDADDPDEAQPIWKINLDRYLELPNKDFGGTGFNIISKSVGVISTPVIDPVSKIMYVVCLNSSLVYKLHRVDITSGQELGDPLPISGSWPGSGLGSKNKMVVFNSKVQVQRSSLLLLNNKVFIPFGARGTNSGDAKGSHGWIFIYDIASNRIHTGFLSTPNSSLGGVWMSGQGPSADEQGHIYITTGNGHVDGYKGGVDWGNSTLKLTLGQDQLLHILPGKGNSKNFFTPHNVNYLNNIDLDVGSSGTTLVNTGLFSSRPVLIHGSKEGKIYVLDTDNLGGYDSHNDKVINILWGTDHNVGRFLTKAFHPENWYKNIHGTPVYWETSQDGVTKGFLYVMGEESKLKAFPTSTNETGEVGFESEPSSQSPQPAPTGMPGGILSVSAFGNTSGTGIVWVTHPKDKNANKQVAEGVVEAYDAEDVSRLLWTSETNPLDNVGLFAKFAPVTVVNGKVYVPTFSNKLRVYGLKKNTLASHKKPFIDFTFIEKTDKALRKL